MILIKDPAESVVVEFDFASELAAVGSAAVSISILGPGTDPNLLDILDGAAQVSGTSVLQRISGGVAGLNYKLRCEATSGADIIVRAGTLQVRTA